MTLFEEAVLLALKALIEGQARILAKQSKSGMAVQYTRLHEDARKLIDNTLL